MNPHATTEAKRVELHATVIRADGTREDLGCIASHDRRPFRRLLDKLRGRGRVKVR